MISLERLRSSVIARLLFPEGKLDAAITRMGFVQADPIRSPATAQDLILRHRVKDYQVGDLERAYPSLAIEEDMLYAYGFMPSAARALLHPRKPAKLSAFDKKVLGFVGELGTVHPRALEPHLGNQRVINAWGGNSKKTTRALDWLHYRGYLRVVRREKGIRVYALTPPLQSFEPAARLRSLVLMIMQVLGPIPERTLTSNIARYRHLGDPRAGLRELLRDGALEKQHIAGMDYVWSGKLEGEALPRVRFLAPFDPVVWDRQRFEHLWGWAYRFEAYTPIAKRVRGYYAMPILWGDRVIGWANADSENVDVGYVDKAPRDAAFGAELGKEIERLRAFLKERNPPRRDPKNRSQK